MHPYFWPSVVLTSAIVAIAVTELLKSNEKSSNIQKSSGVQLNTPTKRSAAIFEEDNNSDSENVDPSLFFSAKKPKCDGSESFTKPAFISLSTDKPVTPPTNTFASPTKRKYTPESTQLLPRTAPSSAPAGREILRPKRIGALSKRSSLSPFKRIDPPVFGGSKASTGSVPFSIDAALSGTLSAYPATDKPQSKVTKLHKAQPKGWFFDLHEDTPDQENAVIMLHTCRKLDLSSDEEDGPSQKRSKYIENKENMPPAEYTVPQLALATDQPRARVRLAQANDMTDDGDRSPLSDLAPEDYYANGLDKDSVVVVADGHPNAVESTAEDATASDKPAAEVATEVIPTDTPKIPISQPSIDTTDGHSLDFVIAEDHDTHP